MLGAGPGLRLRLVDIHKDSSSMAMSPAVEGVSILQLENAHLEHRRLVASLSRYDEFEGAFFITPYHEIVERMRFTQGGVHYRYLTRPK